MGGRTSGKKPSHDYALLLAQYDADYVPQGRTLEEFCKDRDIFEDYKTISAGFIRERKRTAMGAFHDRNKPLLLGAQRMVMAALTRAQAESDPIKAGEFALKVYEKVAEREEPNPLLTLNQNLIIPPLFPPSAMAAKAIEALTGKSPAVKVIEGGTSSDEEKGASAKPGPADGRGKSKAAGDAGNRPSSVGEAIKAARQSLAVAGGSSGGRADRPGRRVQSKDR